MAVVGSDFCICGFFKSCEGRYKQPIDFCTFSDVLKQDVVNAHTQYSRTHGSNDNILKAVRTGVTIILS